MILPATLLVLLWGLTIVRIPGFWRDRPQRALSAAVLALAVSRTVVFPPLAARLEAPALQHLAAMVAAYFLLRFILLVTGRVDRGWDAASAGVVIALLGVAAARWDLLGTELTPVAVTYWVLLDVYLGSALAAAAAVFWTIGTDVPPGMPRTALRAIALGGGLLALDSFFRGAVMVALGAGVAVDLATLDPPASAAQAAGVLLMVSGGAVAALPRTRTVLRAYRSLLILRPLWRAMRDAFPEVILFTPRRAVVELAGVDDVHLRVYRRVIEIRDGMLALRAYLPEQPTTPPSPPTTPPDGQPSLPASSPTTQPSPPTSSPATQPSPPASSDFSDMPGLVPSSPASPLDPAEAEAEAIVAALRRRALGAQPYAVTGTWAVVGPEMDDEVAWLSRVSAAYRRARKVTPAGAPTPRPSGSAR